MESAHPQSCLQEVTACICRRGVGGKHLKICFMCRSDSKRQLFFPQHLVSFVLLVLEQKTSESIFLSKTEYVLRMCCVSIAWCTSAHKHVSYVHFGPHDARETNFLRAAVTDSLCGEAVSQQALKETCRLNQQVAPRLQRFRNLCQLL